jgi:hypothetical protein
LEQVVWVEQGLLHQMVAILYLVQLLQQVVVHLLVEVVEVVVAAISKALLLELAHLVKAITEAQVLLHTAHLVGLVVVVEALVQLARRQLADQVRAQVA